MVGSLDKVKVMLDDNYRVPLICKALQNKDEFRYILGVKSRGRLVEDINGATCRAFRKLRREFDALLPVMLPKLVLIIAYSPVA